MARIERAADRNSRVEPGRSPIKVKPHVTIDRRSRQIVGVGNWRHIQASGCREFASGKIKTREVVKYTGLRTLQRKVFVGGGVRETGNETEARFGNARTDGIDKDELPDRRVDRPLVYYLLHLVQDRLRLGAIELNRLLLISRVLAR